MFRAIICNENKNAAHELFVSFGEAMKRLSLNNSEISFVTDVNILAERFMHDMRCCDAVVLVANNDQHLSLAEKIRSKNLSIFIMFLVKDDASWLHLLQYRPGALINGAEDSEMIAAALRRAYHDYQVSRPYFTVKNKDMIMRIPYEDIMYFESRKRIVVLYTRTQIIEFYGKLGDLLDVLPSDIFLRCHQSYIINLDSIKSLDKANRCFVTKRNQRVEISKSSYNLVVDRYTNG